MMTNNGTAGCDGRMVDIICPAEQQSVLDNYYIHEGRVHYLTNIHDSECVILLTS